jgi:hypothetical protein
MSYEYDLYLAEHRANVAKGFEWIVANLPGLISDFDDDIKIRISSRHDLSKDRPAEYEAYDAYFYGGNRSHKVVQDYNVAWLRHLHSNPHHWQYWILINDDPKQGEIILEMPYDYIIEMICDWWSFSWKTGNLTEIFKWYEEHSKYIKLATKTRATVESILRIMKAEIEMMAELGGYADQSGLQYGA